MTADRQTWTPTTHDWSADVDLDHPDDVRRRAVALAPAGLLHLILEVVAYADDEAAALKHRGQVSVQLSGSGWVWITDDGRGTDTRQDADGTVVRKPIMATRDLRFFGVIGGGVLPDGCARHGISIVAGLCAEAEHTNVRADGAWTQRYRRGVSIGDLLAVDRHGRASGTTIGFVLPPDSPLEGAVSSAELADLCSQFDHVAVEVDDRRRTNAAPS